MAGTVDLTDVPINYDEAFRNMGIELGTACARIYILLEQVKALTAERDALKRAAAKNGG